MPEVQMRLAVVEGKVVAGAFGERKCPFETSGDDAGGRRGTITGFTRASRKRLLHQAVGTMAMLSEQPRHDEELWFGTFTLGRNGEADGTCSTVRAAVVALVNDLLQYGTPLWLYRYEDQPRSGNVHVHLIVSLPRYLEGEGVRNTLTANWLRRTGNGGSNPLHRMLYGVLWKPVEKGPDLAGYMSKIEVEFAKRSQETSMCGRRHWVASKLWRELAELYWEEHAPVVSVDDVTLFNFETAVRDEVHDWPEEEPRSAPSLLMGAWLWRLADELGLAGMTFDVDQALEVWRPLIE